MAVVLAKVEVENREEQRNFLNEVDSISEFNDVEIMEVYEEQDYINLVTRFEVDDLDFDFTNLIYNSLPSVQDVDILETYE